MAIPGRGEEGDGEGEKEENQFKSSLGDIILLNGAALLSFSSENQNTSYFWGRLKLLCSLAFSSKTGC